MDFREMFTGTMPGRLNALMYAPGFCTVGLLGCCFLEVFLHSSQVGALLTFCGVG